MRVCLSEDDRNGSDLSDAAEPVHNNGGTSRADACELEWLKRCFSEILFGLITHRKIVEKPSLVDQKVEFDTPAKQMHVVLDNTVEDLSEITRSVTKKFILVKF